jgi:hypothetical protein
MNAHSAGHAEKELPIIFEVERFQSAAEELHGAFRELEPVIRLLAQVHAVFEALDD